MLCNWCCVVITVLKCSGVMRMCICSCSSSVVYYSGTGSDSGSGNCNCSCLSIHLSIYLSNLIQSYLILSYPSIYPSIYLSVCLSTCLPASLKTKLFCETSSMFEFDNVKNEKILRDFLYLRTWLLKKRSNSARLPQVLKLTTSKTKQLCEISFKNGTLSAELTASCQRVLRFFPSICLKHCTGHEKVMPGLRSAAPVTQNHLRKPEDLMLQNATPLRKSALTS